MGNGGCSDIAQANQESNTSDSTLMVMGLHGQHHYIYLVSRDHADSHKTNIYLRTCRFTTP